MAVPKYKKSKARSRMRRANWFRMSLPNLIPCPQCGAYMMPHRVCESCGFYKGKFIAKFIKEKKKKK